MILLVIGIDDRERPLREIHAHHVAGDDARAIVLGLQPHVDHQLRPADLLTVRYYINNSATNVTGSYGNPVADPLADATDVRVQSLTGLVTPFFSPGPVRSFGDAVGCDLDRYGAWCRGLLARGPWYEWVAVPTR